MTEAENTGVIEEIATPNAEEIGQHQQNEQQEENTQVRKETDQEINFRRLREKNERLEREREQDRQVMMEMQKELLSRQQAISQPAAEPDEFEGIDRSDWSTIDQTEKLATRIADARFEKKWAEAEAKRRQEDLPNRIKAKFQDFESVVTESNIQQLNSMEPDVALAISKIADEEAKAVAAYKYIKAFLPGANEVIESKNRIQENSNLPKSVSSTGGSSPLSQISTFEQGLTPELKKHLLAEMVSCGRKG